MERKAIPGTLKVTVVYTLTEKNELRIDYDATNWTRRRPSNLTNHTYWNLAGEGDILDHRWSQSRPIITPCGCCAHPDR